MRHEKHTIEITPEEREMILAHAPLPQGLAARLRFALYSGRMLEVDVTLEEFAIFADSLAEALNSIKKKSDIRKLQDVYVRLSTYLERVLPGEEDEDDDEFDEEALMAGLPEEMQEELRAVLSSASFDSFDEAFEAVKAVMLKHNQAPQAALMGLTAEQGFNLMDRDWTEPDAPLQLNDELSPEELAGSQYLQSAITFLRLIDASDGLKLTPNKNLNRKAVEALLEAGVCPKPLLDRLRRFSSKAFNEEEVWPVHIAHVLLLESRLARHFKGKLVLTKLGRSMMAPERAGQLQCLLFTTLFRDLNLAYLDSAPEFPGVQDSFPFILYAIRALASETVPLADLVDRAFLPDVQAEFMNIPEFRYDDFVMLSRVLAPLAEFGLVELHEVRKGPGDERNPSTARVLPLFDRMIRFSF